MDHLMHISYLEQLLLVACGFVIVLITRYTFNESELKPEGDSFSRRGSPYHNVNSASSRRSSHSYSSPTGYSKRRGRRTFGIKHL